MSKKLVMSLALAVAFLFATNVRADLVRVGAGFFEGRTSIKLMIGLCDQSGEGFTYYWDHTPESGADQVSRSGCCRYSQSRAILSLLALGDLSNIAGFSIEGMTPGGDFTDVDFASGNVLIDNYIVPDRPRAANGVHYFFGDGGLSGRDVRSLFLRNPTAQIYGTLVEMTSYRLDRLDVSTPAPATLAIVGLGLAGLGFARRRQMMKK